jgi:hypothetical protein
LNQADWPHLLVVSDAGQEMARSLEVLHPRAGKWNADTNAPTTILVDGGGSVRWLYRPARFTDRLPPDDLLAAIDDHLHGP